MRAIIAASACVVTLAVPAYAQVEEEPDCPLVFIGVKVTTADVRDGVSIEFRNPNGANVEEMRAQLREVAQLLEDHGTQVQTTGADDEEVDFPPVDISVKNIARGARVTVRAARYRDIPVLRELAYGFAEFWETSPCITPLITML